TQQLMNTFYKYWLQLGDKRQAFQKAQLDVKKSHPEPFYWGAFVMIGS
ncbi:MAG: CHAT domain-containing protein, partial [Bacteroidales bacterium]|nr:CHAT domain-containing protein [Bacteroidales bacterium]